jgi:hypothetical protein
MIHTAMRMQTSSDLRSTAQGEAGSAKLARNGSAHHVVGGRIERVDSRS